AMDSCTIAQQIDIMPTVLDYLGYDNYYVAFGKSLISTPAENSYAVNYINDSYQYYKGDYLLQFDGTKSTALYNVRNDALLKENIIGTMPAQQEAMEREVKAIIQQYMWRMLNDKLVPDGNR
ncbi:MAG: LTA synthase family protein, partial [Bacteroidaceae bacterium]|nr:LTA synthase family protein [Bacteroidaceae bacterium]